MPRDERWFRSADWDDAAQTEFATRLARARPFNRVQYKRVKAIALLESGDPISEKAGRQLLQDNISSDEVSDFEKVNALRLLARHELSRGELEAAEGHLRSNLAIPIDSGRNGEEEIDLAEILMAKGSTEALAEAAMLLSRRAADPPLFISSLFRLDVARVKLALLGGDPLTARTYAQSALNLSRETRSGLQNHPTLGLVQTDEPTIRWLRSIALSESPRRQA